MINFTLACRVQQDLSYPSNRTPLARHLPPPPISDQMSRVTIFRRCYFATPMSVDDGNGWVVESGENRNTNAYFLVLINLEHKPTVQTKLSIPMHICGKTADPI